jgi:O-antigen ligase
MIYVIFGYIYLLLHRPMEIWPALEPFRIELIYFGFLCVAWIVARKRISFDCRHWAILFMAGAVGLSWLLSPWAESGIIPVKNYALAIGFALILATTLRDERTLQLVITAFLAVMALYMLHSVREYLLGRHTYRMGISRLIGVDRSLGDPNSFGASILYALPFVRYLWFAWQPGWRRKMLVLYVLLSIGCIGLTGSRSAFVGLIVWGMATIWLSGRRKLPLIAFGLIAGAVGFMTLPEELQTRFTTIIDPSVGPENARESGQGRIEGLFVGFDLWSKNPITGVGPGAWQPASGRTIESHNLYGQVLGELGTVGACAFAFMIGSIAVGVRRLTREIRQNEAEPRAVPLFHLAQAIALSTMLLLFEGNFGHNLYRFNYLWYCVFAGVALRAYREQLATQEADNEEAEWVPVWA